MKHTFRFLAIGAMSAFAMACADGEASMGDDLEKDLRDAEASSLELAPSGAGQDVVSSIELSGGRVAAPSERRPVATRKPAPTPEAREAVENPEGIAEMEGDVELEGTSTVLTTTVPAPTPVDTGTATRGTARPEPLPAPTRRRGPYKSVEEVIRNAPFPIKP